MLLPSMAATLQLSYAQMGFISTGNFIGYLLPSFSAAWSSRASGNEVSFSFPCCW